MTPISRILKPLSLLPSLQLSIKRGEERRRRRRSCGCVDSLCWLIGYICTLWWFLLFVYSSLSSSSSSSLIDETPGVKLKREGLRALHPVVLVPGLFSGDLELWQGKPCADDLFRRSLWGGATFGDLSRRSMCWVEHMGLDRETGMDPAGVRVRAVPGLVAGGGGGVFAGLIQSLAQVGYEGKNLYMPAYDWRLSFQNTEVRDQSLSRLKATIELMVRTSGGRKAVIVPYSTGALYFLHFLNWVEAEPPMGGGGGSEWCNKHIKAVMNVEPAFLGDPKAMTAIYSDEAKEIADAIRAMSPGILDSNILGIQALQGITHAARTWDSINYLFPKGDSTISGGSGWSLEENFDCDRNKRTTAISFVGNKAGPGNGSDEKEVDSKSKMAWYSSIISFTKIASWSTSDVSVAESKHKLLGESTYLPMKSSGEYLKPEHNERGDSRTRAIEVKNPCISSSSHDLLNFGASKMTQRASDHFSHGQADDLNDLKYSHYKYWSNPLETKLPDAPDVEIYCLYGVDMQNGILANVDKKFRFLSAGFMCAKVWRGRTRFNPSGVPTFVREYEQRIPTTTDLTEDIIRVASGYSGKDIGGDRIFSSIRNVSENVKLRLH